MNSWRVCAANACYDLVLMLVPKPGNPVGDPGIVKTRNREIPKHGNPEIWWPGIHESRTPEILKSSNRRSAKSGRPETWMFLCSITQCEVLLIIQQAPRTRTKSNTLLLLNLNTLLHCLSEFACMHSLRSVQREASLRSWQSCSFPAGYCSIRITPPSGYLIVSVALLWPSS